MSIKNRPTKELKTPNGHTVVVYDYITGGEMMQFQEIFLENMSTTEIVAMEKDGASDKISAVQMLKGKRLLAELLVVSVDGDTEMSVLDLLVEDSQFILTTLDSYVTESGGKKK